MGFPDGATALTVMLVVSDVDRSTAWYVDVLGAQLERTYGGTSSVLKLLDTWVLLVTGGGPTADKPTVTLAAPADAERVSSQMIFRVESCQASYESLRDRGADFLSPPVDHGHEVRAFFLDPDGHLFEISELVPAP